jgi:predicted metalloenzyme YecM
MIKNIFEKTTVDELIGRINQLEANKQPLWGKMDAAQMLAHCCVTYEMIYEQIHPQPGKLKKWLLRMIIKPIVTGEKTYPKSTRTAPEFIITGNKNFVDEKNRLIDYMRNVQKDGVDFFEGKNSHSFGPLTAKEWNNMMYKHLDHHLHQFGV